MSEDGVSQVELVERGEDNGKKLPQYIAALSATLGSLATGSIIGWSSPVIYKITQANSTDYDFPVSVSQGAWIGSLSNLGSAAICIPIGLIMDAIGRKTTMLCLVIPYTVGWLLIAFATNVGMLLIGRFITGLAGGAFCVTAPAYTSEIAQDSIRGSLGTFYHLMLTIGILFSYSVGSYTSVFVFNILCTLIPIIFGFIFFFMPESPKFLVVKGKYDEAKDALIRLRGNNYDVDSEMFFLKLKAKETKNNPVSPLSSITKKTTLKAILICYALMFLQQLSGTNAVIYNTSAIFDSAGATIAPEISTIIIGVIKVVSTLVSTLVVDKLGRRILLMFSALLMCVCCTTLGLFFVLQDIYGTEASIVTAISWLPLVSLSVFVFAYSVGLGPIPWMMASELCLIEIKAFVSSTAGTLNKFFGFTVTSTFSSLSAAIGVGQVFWMYAGIMLAGFVFIHFVVPETKGKSVYEVQLMLGAEPEPQRPDERKNKSVKQTELVL